MLFFGALANFVCQKHREARFQSNGPPVLEVPLFLLHSQNEHNKRLLMPWIFIVDPICFEVMT